MLVLTLALKSLLNRKFTALLTLLSIALSVALLLGVERLRTEARSSFANTISGTDLIVGARSGSINLLLYSVFRIGNPTNNISWASYQEIARLRSVAWTVPLSLGDSHRGFRVLGTTPAYFEHYRFAGEHELRFAKGVPFSDLYDAVIGAEVAQGLGYELGQSIVIAHGMGAVSFSEHADKPFRVAGILAPTGTPVDRTVHVSLEAIEAIHQGWQSGAPSHRTRDESQPPDLTPQSITAVLVGLNSKLATFRVQRAINDYAKEALSAVMPGVALQELWDIIGTAEKALLAVSAFVVLVGLTGMLTAILATLNERRRELAILRSVGARPSHIFLLVMSEAVGLAALGALFGLALLYLVLAAARPWVESLYGLHIGLGAPAARELWILFLVVGVGLIVSFGPAYRAYRYSLADGLSIRV